MSLIPNKGFTLVSASGALSPLGGFTAFGITKLSSLGVCAMTLAAPAADGEELVIVDQVGAAHTLTATSLVNGGGKSLITWGGTIGSTLRLLSDGGYWWVVGLQGVTVTS